MSDPMSNERLAEIRERADLVREFGERPTVEASAGDVPALLAEVERLTRKIGEAIDALGAAQSAARVAREDLSVEQVKRHRAERERDESRAEVERLRAELDARCDKDGCEQYREWLSGEKAEEAKRARQAETERDRLAEQVQRVRLCWKSARRGRARARAELAAWQAAGRTTDLEGDVGDHLSDLADWETPNAIAPDWLVKAVVDLLAPIAAERDRLTRERDGLVRADKAGQQWASRRINTLEEKIHRTRQVHAPQCGGGCAAVHCECGPDDLVCAECETPAPCATIRALDQEAGR